MDSLSELDGITSFYSPKGNIIITGDFNAHLPRAAIGTDRQFQSKAFGEFIMRYNLVDMASTVVSPHYDQVYSYCQLRSPIYHNVPNADFSSCVVTLSVVQENYILTSGHLPLLCTFRINV